MKRYLFFFLCLLCLTPVFSQGMSDQQILQFIARENRAGRSQRSTLQAPPWLCLHLEKACFQKSPSIYLSDPTSREKP